MPESSPDVDGKASWSDTKPARTPHAGFFCAPVCRHARTRSIGHRTHRTHRNMEKVTLNVCTFADTEDQEATLVATGHYGDEVEAYERGRELARAMLSIGGGLAAQIDPKKGEYPFMRRLTVMLYPAQDGEPEEEMVQTDIRPKEECDD